MRIIDSHVHIYPEKIAARASAGIGEFYSMPVKYDGTVTRLREICERNNISKCVACSVATVSEQVVSINNFLAESVAQSGGFIAGLCALHPDMSEVEIESELLRIKALGLIGIKIHPDFQRFRVDGARAYKIYDSARGKFPILIHAGDKRFGFSQPAKLAKVMRDFPDLTIIAAHFGGWSEWGDVKCLAGFDNLYVDTSSSLYELIPETANKLINMFGGERVLFGTDYPMWDADGELKFIERLKLPERVREFILYKNAERVYKL